MFFGVSKMLWQIGSPLTFLVLVLLVGVVFIKRPWGQNILRSGIALLVLIGFFPVGHNLLVALENVYSDITLPQKVDGMIMLGGTIDLSNSVARRQVQLKDNPDRLIELARLSLQYPQAKCVVSGGNGEQQSSASTEAAQTKILLNKLHIPTEKMIFEDKSRTTYENMAFSKELVHPQSVENWLLITSAYHLPRAVAVFSSNGWPVTPVAAGYLTDGAYRYAPTLDVLGSYYKFQVAVKEIVGIIAYTLTERIKTDENHEDNADLHALVTAPTSVGTVDGTRR